MRRLGVFVILSSALLLGCKDDPNKREREVCENAQKFVVETLGDLAPKLSDEEREKQIALCIEDLLKLKAKLTPEKYDQMIECARAAKDLRTFSACDAEESVGSAKAPTGSR